MRSSPRYLLLALLALWGLGSPMFGQDSRPNIVFIFTDDHASHAISAYGSKINETPNLDRLANEGMLFRNTFCTNSICAPSRAVILTGKHSHLNGVIDNRETFDGSQQTFPKLLQKAGYATAMIGKWHLKSDPTGFDHWEVLIGQGPYYNPPFKTPSGVERNTGYTTDIITDKVLSWLKEGRDEEKPFMLFFQHKAPHREWAPGPDYLTMYDDVEIPEPPTLFDDYEGRTSAAKEQEMTLAEHFSQRDAKLVPPGNLTPEQLDKWNAAYGPKNEAFREANLQGKDLVRWRYQRYIKDYLRCVASVDDNVGRVLDYLDDSGLADNTIVIYSSDQGFYLGDHGWYDKRWMYEESLRMPLMVRWPGVIKPGSENKDLVQNLDFAETVLDVAGIEIPDDMQGRSIVPLLKGETPDDWRKSIYYHYFEWPAVHMVQRHYGVRTDRYKLIRYYLINEWELFDLEKDPDELQSVYDDPAYSEIVATLKKELERLRKKYRVDEYDEELPAIARDPNKVELERVLHFAFDEQGGDNAKDSSKSGWHVGLENAEFGKGVSGGSLKLTGEGFGNIYPRPNGLDPTKRPLTLGAWIKPTEQDGVIAAQGGESHGYSLYIRNALPRLAYRSKGNLYEAEARLPAKLNEWNHVAATIDADGNIQLYLNGEESGIKGKAEFITQQPFDVFSIGADTGSHVGDYASDLRFKGEIDDLRLYWGVLPVKDLSKWAAN